MRGVVSRAPGESSPTGTLTWTARCRQSPRRKRSQPMQSEEKTVLALLIQVSTQPSSNSYTRQTSTSTAATVRSPTSSSRDSKRKDQEVRGRGQPTQQVPKKSEGASKLCNVKRENHVTHQEGMVPTQLVHTLTERGERKIQKHEGWEKVDFSRTERRHVASTPGCTWADCPKRTAIFPESVRRKEEEELHHLLYEVFCCIQQKNHREPT